MDFFDKILRVAPFIAGLVATPAAGFALHKVIETLGKSAKKGATVTELTNIASDAISKATEKDLEKLKQVDATFEKEAADVGLDLKLMKEQTAQVAIHAEAQTAQAEIQAGAQTTQTEIKHGGFLASNWRPITMLAFVGIVVAHAFGLTCGMEKDEVIAMFDIIKIGLGGYVFARTAEKIAPGITNSIISMKK